MIDPTPSYLLHRGLNDRLDEVLNRLRRYESLLTQWNRTYNLVGPSFLHDLWTRHFREPFSLLSMLPPGASMLDLGSGAGFPGLVLGILMDESTPITLLESSEKKCRFLRQVAHELGLSQVRVVQKRAEDFVHEGHRFHSVTLRAVADARLSYALAAPLVEKGGQILLLKGAGYRQELQHWQSIDPTYQEPEVIQSPDLEEGVILRFTHVSRETM